MKKLGPLFFLLIVLTVSGCATAPPSIPGMRIIQTAPEYTHAIPIPLKVGVMLDDNLTASSYELVVIKEWEKMQLFDSLVYPYQENSPVDIVMRLSIIKGEKEVTGGMEEIVERELENEEGYVVKEVVEETLLKMRRTLLAINRKDDVEKGFYDDEDYSPMSHFDFVEEGYFDPIDPRKTGLTIYDDNDPSSKKMAHLTANTAFILARSSALFIGAAAVPMSDDMLDNVFDAVFDAAFPSTSSMTFGGGGGGVSVPRSAQGATFTHDALAVINQSSDEIGQYSVQVATTIQLGNMLIKDAHGRNYVEGYDAGYELQMKRIAFELAKKIRADRQNLLSKLGKSQEETTTP